MNKGILFTISGFDVNTIGLFSVVSLVIFVFFFWTFQRNKAREEDTFDVAFTGIVIGLIISRIIGFLLNIDKYAELYWSLNPVFNLGGEIDIFSSMPWAIFKIWDGVFFFPIFGFAAVIGIWITSKLRKNFIKARIAIDNAVIAIIFAQIFMNIGLFISGRIHGIGYGGVFAYTAPGEQFTRFPVLFLDILILVLIAFIIFRTASIRKPGLTTAYYLAFYGGAMFLLRFLTFNYNPIFLGLDFGHLLSIVVILFSTLFFMKSKEKDTLEHPRFARVTRADLQANTESKSTFAFSPNRRSVESKSSMRDRFKSIFNKKQTR